MSFTFFTGFLFFSQLITFSLSETPKFINYDSIFLDPNYVVNGNFPNITWEAQETIVQWAQQLALSGPWSVTNKSVTPPSGDKRDFMTSLPSCAHWNLSWWPDCDNVGNTTILPPEEIWTKCTYVQRDGQINPDVRTLVDNIGDFEQVSDAVLYNTLAWSLNKNNASASVFSKNAANFIDIWFLNPTTGMNPNLNFAQMHRGPTGQHGTKTGVLDLHHMTKIVTSILILRLEKNTDWTEDLDNQLLKWSTEYIKWLETDPIAIGESQAKNNHGTFYYGQLAALKVLTGDKDGAKDALEQYFNGPFQGQIIATGEQPLEKIRTRPIHYEFYNLAAMVTNAQMLSYLDPSAKAWNRTTAAGATIQTALNFLFTQNPNDSNEAEEPPEFYVDVASIAAVYGDPSGKAVSYISSGDPNYPAQAYYFWTQPLKGGTAPPASGGSTSGASGSNAASPLPSDSPENAGFTILPAASSKIASIVALIILTSIFL
ncbi:hypothetical protein Clacol_006859 [Clathrus columnatus]|uniref:Alginate lyase domain-containing protein n=1 Tax=Clathrus columnatus TaxID=1419009 RepID=A0AAV5AD97_9AGAM|nr:hypothetical protein Clacol_006859 [Clathrus columnatus]